MPFLNPGESGGQSLFKTERGEIIPPRILCDEYGNPARISAGIPDPNGVVNVSIGDTAIWKEFPKGARKVYFYATVGFYYKFGNNNVKADLNSSQLPGGVGEFNIGNYKGISVLKISNAGNLNITKMD